jgi:hypothetical protein
LLVLLHEEMYELTSSVMPIFARRGQIEWLTWGLERGLKCDPDCVRLAARYGHLGTLVWLIGRGVHARDCATWAAKGGHLSILKWLYKPGIRVEWSDVLHTAVVDGRYDIVKWALERYTLREGGIHLPGIAASEGYLDILKLLRDYGYSWRDAYRCAVKRSQFKVLEYLISERAFLGSRGEPMLLLDARHDYIRAMLQ